MRYRITPANLPKCSPNLPTCAVESTQRIDLRKRWENGGNVILGSIIDSGARDMGWPWTWWIGPAPVQMSGCCLGAALSWFAWWAACGDWLFFIDPSFLVNSHFDHSRAWISACSRTAALLYHCFPSNLSITTQGAIVKLRRASSELCTLFIWSV